MATPTNLAAASKIRDNLVAQFTTGEILLADYSVPWPAALLSTDGNDLAPGLLATPAGGTSTAPTAAVPGFHDLGGVTTDGPTENNSMASTDTLAWQFTSAIRNSTTSDTVEIAVKFQELNPYTFALRMKAPFNTPPVAVGTHGQFQRPRDAAEPKRRLIATMWDEQNGLLLVVGFPKAIIKARGNSSSKRDTPNETDVTIGAYYDSVVGTDVQYAMGGPGWASAT